MKKITSLLILSFLVAGCNSSGSSSDSSTSDSEIQTELPSSNAVAAEATIENGKNASDDVLTSQYGGTSVDVSISDRAVEKSVENKTYIKNLAFKLLNNYVNNKSRATATTVSESAECDYGGSISVTGTTSDTEYAISGSYNNCQKYSADSYFYDGVLNGSLKITIRGTNLDSYYATITYMDISFLNDYTAYKNSVLDTKIEGGTQMTFSNIIGDIDSGSSDYSLDLYLNAEVYTDGVTNRIENYKVKYAYDYSSDKDTICYKSGKIFFDNKTKYFEIDNSFDSSCNYPFVFENGSVLSGKMKLKGEGGNTLTYEVTGTDILTITDESGNSEIIDPSSSLSN